MKPAFVYQTALFFPIKI